MIKIANILRYVIAIVCPMLLLFHPIAGILTCFGLLWMNNYLDDIFFYLSSLGVKNAQNKGSHLMSPVNGIVTKIEKGVEAGLIVKNDVLGLVSGNKEARLVIPIAENLKNEKYDHIAVYLNKFNRHVVLNPSKVVAMYRHHSDGNVEMVSADELVADNVGEYLNNDALIVEYDDFFMVLTMDKFISKYILGDNGSAVCCQICRGSQCDFYLRENTCIYPNEGDCIDIYSPLAEVPLLTEYYNVENDINGIVDVALKSAGGYFQMLEVALRKTCATFSSFVMLLLVVIVPSLASFTTLSTPASYVGFSSIYLFLFVRSYRHLMYSMMNVLGLKDWMVSSYKFIAKAHKLWKK